MFTIEVGQSFPIPCKENEEGMRMEFIGDIPHILCYLPEGTLKEVLLFRTGDIHFKVLSNEEQAFHLILFKVGGMITELLFNPNLYEDEPVQQYMKAKGNALQIILIDSSNNEVLVIRSLGLPYRIRDCFYKIWGNMIEKKTEQKALGNWYDNLIKNYSSKELWLRAENIGTFKE